MKKDMKNAQHVSAQDKYFNNLDLQINLQVSNRNGTVLDFTKLARSLRNASPLDS